ncbi:MAG: lipoyl(octanoyl) transferase LipB [Deltaproteobacteria bacterium]
MPEESGAVPLAVPVLRETQVAGIRCLWLGRVEYSRALAAQEDWIARFADRGDALLLLEHPPVYTTGRGGAEAHLPDAKVNVPVLRIGRGGDVTYHGPGQLVGYPIIDLRTRGRDVHRYLRDLEAGLIDTLGVLGVGAQRCAGRTGIWVARPGGEPRKIASIGIAVRRGIAWHGFALNLSVDLAAFDPIVPCGLEGVEMTSVALETGRAPALAEVAEMLATYLPPRICQA